jgi:hypothetical protein
MRRQIPPFLHLLDLFLKTQGIDPPQAGTDTFLDHRALKLGEDSHRRRANSVDDISLILSWSALVARHSRTKEPADLPWRVFLGGARSRELPLPSGSVAFQAAAVRVRMAHAASLLC